MATDRSSLTLWDRTILVVTLGAVGAVSATGAFVAQRAGDDAHRAVEQVAESVRHGVGEQQRAARGALEDAHSHVARDAGIEDDLRLAIDLAHLGGGIVPEEIVRLEALANQAQTPRASGLAVGKREIADEAMRRGLIPSISQRSVGRFLKKRPTSSRIAFATG